MGLRRLTGLVLFVACGIFVGGCATFAKAFAPTKTATAKPSPDSDRANDAFWKHLHAGNYEGIPALLEQHVQVYLADPSDARTTAHIGFLHIWRLAERARLANIPATITDSAVLSRRYFEEAVRLTPDDARLAGFLASAKLAEGDIHRDEYITRDGYFAMKDAISDWPEFNLFTSGYSMSGRPHDSEQFAEALEQQWENLEVCAGRSVDRSTANYAEVMGPEIKDGPKRACWNSALAPHNFEGFFLNMGDMLVKSGNIEVARKIYAIARHSKDYAKWPYREDLEQRIRDAEQNKVHFRRPSTEPSPARIMFESKFSCTGCHQS